MPRRPNGLEKRGNSWRFRKSYPEELRAIIGRREFVKSLKTGDYQEAYKKYPLMLVEADNVIAQAQRKLEQQQAAKAAQDGTPPIRTLSTEEIQSIVLTWFHDLESGNAPSAEKARGDPMDADAIEDALKGDLDALTGLPEGQRWLETETGTLLATHSVVTGKDSPDYHTVKSLVKRGLIENRTRRLNDINRGRYEADSYFRDVEYVSHLPERIKRNAPKSRLTFGGLLEKYFAEKTVAAKTRDQYEQHARRFIEFVGADTPVEQIDRDAIVGYRNLLEKIPSNASKLFKGKTFQEIADSPKAATYPALSTRSINKVLETLSSLFRFAEEWGYVAKNPAKGLQLAIDDVSNPNNRRTYTTAELQRIFDAPLYRGCMNDESGFARSGDQIIRRHRFWIPLIALYTGMRLNEICQLYLEDINEKDGIAYIDIRRKREDGSIAPDKSLKNKAARRKMPIHSELKRIGLLDYVTGLRAKGETRLFPDLSYARQGGYSDAFQKWYNRFLGTVGFREGNGNGGLVFHSFRHTIRDRLREAEVFPEYAYRLGGWKVSDSTAEGYGDWDFVAKLYEQIEKISYHELSLSHLYIK